MTALPHPLHRARPHKPGHGPALTVLATLIAALLGFFLLVLHDAMSRAATQQTQALQQVALFSAAELRAGAPAGAESAQSPRAA